MRGSRESATGENNTKAKLTKEDVKELKRKIKNTERTLTDISKEYPITVSQISSIKNERTWSHVSVDDE